MKYSKMKLKQLSNLNKKEIKKIFIDDFCIEKNYKFYSFISKYIDCEASARKLVQYNLNKSDSDDFSALYCNQIYSAILSYELDIPKNITREVFKSGKGIRNQKTPRQLRNGLFHKKDINDLIEIENRYEQLIEIMENWLIIVKNI